MNTIQKDHLLRLQRIALLSDVLALKHKHRKYFNEAGSYDTVLGLFENLGNMMKSARAVGSTVWRVDFREREKRLAKERVPQLLAMILNTREPNNIVSMGGKIKATKQKGSFTRNYTWYVTVGWMWNKKVYDQLYYKCEHYYGPYFIMNAEKVRVNHKWIELFEVQAFHTTTLDMVTGYVARTKTPKRHTNFHKNASIAVANAEGNMLGEMKQELNIERE